jgi:GH15 family glucan-1,4-alpha-glucosidase
MAYQPIENYGIIGDMHTAALVGMEGSIDWLCYPHFDSPSVFAAILDDNKGGYFKIAPTAGNVTHKQFYWPETNVLVTRFLSAAGVGEITDYMTVTGTAGVDRHHPHQLFRRVSVIRGEMAFRMECYPAFNYARTEHTVSISSEGASFNSPDLNLGLATRIPLQQRESGAVAEFTLREGETAVFLLQEIESGEGCCLCLSEEEGTEVFKETVAFWRRWLSKSTYEGR